LWSADHNLRNAELDPSLVGVLSTDALLLERLYLYLQRVHIQASTFILHLVVHQRVVYEVLTATTVKSSVFWDVTYCDLVIICIQIKNLNMVHAGYQLGLLFEPADGGDMLLGNVG
jgi:hypothetical protein